jgi:DNA-binding FadR family transcriptional regulator
VDALTSGKPDQAERAMRRHLNRVAQALHATQLDQERPAS